MLAAISRSGAETRAARFLPIHTALRREGVRRETSERDDWLLLEAGQVLISAADEEEMLRLLARLVADSIADFCVIDRFVTDGRHWAPVGAHRDPGMQPILEEAIRSAASPAMWPGVASPLESGRFEWTSEVADPAVAATAADESHCDLLRQLGARAQLIAPIRVGDRVLGSLTLVRTSADAAYAPGDVWVSQDLACRTGLAIENRRLYLQARQATRTRDEVLRMVAHELRSPLGTIRLTSGALDLSLPPTMEKERRQLQLIDRAVQISDRLIDDLLDAARIQAGCLRIDPEPTAGGDILLEVMELHARAAAQKSIVLQCDVGDGLPPIAADRGRVLQVLSNLVGNAVKFTRGGGRIALLAEKERESVRFSVSDDGNGIAARDQPRIFDVFWQARPGGGGAGLGLALSRGIVEAHGGEFSVTSEAGRGSTFSFTIPLASRSSETTLD